MGWPGPARPGGGRKLQRFEDLGKAPVAPQALGDPGALHVGTGEEAVPLKLIDQIGDFRAAIDDTAKSVGIKGEPTLVHPEKERKSMLDLLFGDVSDYLPSREKLMETNVGFYYLWK